MESLGVVALLGTGAGVAAYVALNWRLQRRAEKKRDPEVCSTGDPHLWRGSFQFPPPKGPVEEDCDVCLARRVVDYGEGYGEPKVLRYEPLR